MESFFELMSPRPKDVRIRARNDSTRQYVTFSHFLLPEELNGLLEHALVRREKFKRAEVLRPGHRGRVVFRYRRSHVLVDLGEFSDVITYRIRSYLPWVVRKLGIPPFRVRRALAHVTANNDGDFFKRHTDFYQGRVITFVYYFYREPKRFTGGELRLYHTNCKNGRVAATRDFDTILPQQNHIVFFPSFLVHEVSRVRCPSHALEDSRFTVTGWVYR